MSTSLYERRLGHAHFRHLHAVAEGLSPEDAAQRYLAAYSRPAARQLHEETLRLLRAIVQRRGDPRWRLVTMIGRLKSAAGNAPVLPATGAPAPHPTAPAPAAPFPSYEQWIKIRGINPGDWGERELWDMYTRERKEAAEEAAKEAAESAPDEAVAPAPCEPAETKAMRRQTRAARLVARQRDLLREIEPVAVVRPHRADRLSVWFDNVTAQRMERSGLLLLGELQDRIAAKARSGQWWRHLPAIGAAKAARIEAYMATLLGPPTPAGPSAFERLGQIMSTSVHLPDAGSTARGDLVQWPPRLPDEFDGSCGLNRTTPRPAGTQACNDLAAIEAWIEARVGRPGEDAYVPETARAYRLEAERLVLWCIIERRKPMSSMDSADCSAYKAFLADVPERWISRKRAARHQPGWAPFARQPSRTSQQHALTIVASMFRWLVQAHYLAANPWAQVKTRLGDDPKHSELDTRALTPAAWDVIIRYIEQQPPSAARARAAFVLDFSLGVGLRAAELIAARLGDLSCIDGCWALPVHGKGKRNRTVAVPGHAVRALEAYLQARGLPEMGQLSSRPDLQALPLVASVHDPQAAVGYRALYDSLKVWMGNAIRAHGEFTEKERQHALRASLHWLRHTCGTRALERGVTVPELQGQFGHADPRTTMRYGKTQLQSRQAAFERAFS